MSNVTLACPSCGQPLTVEQTKFEEVFVSKGKGYMYIGDTTVETDRVSCTNPQCGHTLNLREQVSLPQTGPQKISTNGGAFIGGAVNTGGGNFTGRDKIVHIHTEETTVKTTRRKGW